MDFVDLSKELAISFDVSLILAVALVMWKFMTSFRSNTFLSEAYAGQGASQPFAPQNRSQSAYPQQTLSQAVFLSQEMSQETPQAEPQPEEPQQAPEEAPQEEVEPRTARCTLNDLNALNDAVRCTSANGKHKSPLQPSGSRCFCTRCGQSMFPIVPSP